MTDLMFTEGNLIWLKETIQLYDAPLVISFVAATARSIYSQDIETLRDYFYQWFLSFFVTLLVLHYSLWKGIDPNLSIVLEGAAAFIAREFLTFSIECVTKFSPIIELLTGHKRK